MRQVLELKFSQIVGLLNTVRRPFHVKKSHELIKMPTDGVSMKLVRKLHNLPCVIQPLAANVDKPVTVAYRPRSRLQTVAHAIDSVGG